ncbi:MAG: hypothetical protein L3J49_04325 [Desulfobulbaceae bacterium]|nr:hypothetical protein [Desulfobulbaceae bacterium]
MKRNLHGSFLFERVGWRGCRPTKYFLQLQQGEWGMRRWKFVAVLTLLFAACFSLAFSRNLVPIYGLLLSGDQWAPPSNLVARSVSARSVALSWDDNSDGETGFLIETRHGAGAWGQIYMVAADSRSIALGPAVAKPLLPDTLYEFRVRAYTGNASFPTKITDYSNVATARTSVAPTSAPATPVALDAVGVDMDSIVVSWNDQSDDEDMFTLERSRDDCSSFSSRATLSADVTSYKDTGLDANRTYCYRVKASNLQGYSGYSNSGSATTLNPPVPPAAPSGLAAQPCDRGAPCIFLAWEDNSANEDRFVIERKPPGGAWKEIGTSDRNQYKYTDAYQIAALTTYVYRVGAENRYGTTYSNESTGYSMGGEFKPDWPKDPLAQGESSNTILLQWTDASDNEERFVIHRSLSGDTGTYVQAGEVGPGVTSFYDSGLNPDTTYYYTVSACNFAGCGTSGPTSGKTKPAGSLTSPSSPGSLAVNVISQDSSVLHLSWTDYATNEDGFKLYRNTVYSKPSAPIQTLGANVSSFDDTGLNGCTTYYYWVEAFNSAGTSTAPANSGTTPPGPPGGMIASQGTVLNGIYLDWDNVTCAQEYNVYELTNQDGNWTRLNLPGSITTNLTTIGDVQPMVYLFYRVTGVDSSGNEGTPSQYVTGWASGAVPTGVAGSRGTYSDKIAVTWEPVQTCPQGQGINARYINQYDISWSDAPNGAFTKFKTVQVDPTASDPAMPIGTSPDPVSIDISNADASTYFPGLTQGVKYYFAVQSTYKVDLMCDDSADSPTVYESGLSAPAEGWIQAQPTNYLPAPAWLTASDSQLCRIDLNWAPVSGAASYKVYRSPSVLAPTWSLQATVTTTSMTQVVDAGLNVIPWSSYWYIVTPVSSSGVEGYASPYDGGYASRGLTNCY